MNYKYKNFAMKIFSALPRGEKINYVFQRYATKLLPIPESRFIEKADKVRLESFMEREKPKLPKVELETFKPEIKTLHDKGYTVEQIITFLAENNVIVSAATIRNFLKEN